MILIILFMSDQLPEPLGRLPPSALTGFALETGEVLFRTGDNSRGFFFLTSGNIRLLRRTCEGGETLIHLARAGTTFAEAALFAQDYHCDAVAMTRASGILLHKADVETLFATDAEFARKIALRFAKQVQGLRRSIEILAIRPAQVRVLTALGDYERSDAGDILALPPLKVFAAQIGLTHEALYRAVANLVREGRLARIGRGQLRIPLLPPGRSDKKKKKSPA